MQINYAVLHIQVSFSKRNPLKEYITLLLIIMFPSTLRTGLLDNTTRMETDDLLLEKKIEGILFTFLEKAVVLGATYAIQAGRHNITGTDIIYALQYFAHEFMNDPNLEEQFEDTCSALRDEDESYESDDSSMDSDDSVMESDDEEFTRVTNSTDAKMILMNTYHDEWHTWEPIDPFQKSIKGAVDSCIAQFDITFD